jgi:peptidoglycan/xylan/chitin deacetylase (PgdA/CDA1 family)
VGGVIICYHHISSGTLEEQLKRLSRWYTIVPLGDLVSRHEKGKSTVGLLAVTFDDGFAQEVESGCAAALKYSWPMTFYLTTGFVTSGQPFWFEEVGPLLKVAPAGKYEVDGLRFRLGDARSRAQARDMVVRHLFHRHASEIEDRMAGLRKALFGSSERPSALQISKPISWERVKALSGHEEVAFQAHSVTHPFFSLLSPDQIRKEMESSRRQIEEMTAKPVQHFCYPYGTRKAIGVTAPELAGDLFRSAATIIHGRCLPGADRTMLPRITLFEHYTPAMASMKVATTR